MTSFWIALASSGIPVLDTSAAPPDDVIWGFQNVIVNFLNDNNGDPRQLA